MTSVQRNRGPSFGGGQLQGGQEGRFGPSNSGNGPTSFGGGATCPGEGGGARYRCYKGQSVIGLGTCVIKGMLLSLGGGFSLCLGSPLSASPSPWDKCLHVEKEFACRNVVGNNFVWGKFRVGKIRTDFVGELIISYFVVARIEDNI